LQVFEIGWSIGGAKKDSSMWVMANLSYILKLKRSLFRRYEKLAQGLIAQIHTAKDAFS
jgi:hypothetical protein